MSELRIQFSWSSLWAISAIVLAIIVLWQLQSLLVLLMVAIVLAASIAPVIDWAERWHVPRWLSVILVYITLLLGLVGVALAIGPSIAAQLELLLRQLPASAERAIAAADAWIAKLSEPDASQLLQLLDVQALIGWAIGSSQKLLLRSYSITRGILGTFAGLILAVFISGYMSADSYTLVNRLTRLFPKPWNERLEAQVKPMSDRMGTYIRGRLLVSAILSVAITTGLSLLGLSQLALALGAIAGVTNLIPFVGPVLGAIPAVIVAIAQGGWTVLWVLLLFVVIQNLESYVLDPLLVGSSVGVHPLFQLLAVLGGVQVLGILGAIVVPPWFAGTSVLIENLYLQPKLAAERGLNVLAEADNLAAVETISTPEDARGSVED
ncbi:MAG: AI-2E family transporter [Cyanobacteria bacterium P01_D01_bin.123]